MIREQVFWHCPNCWEHMCIECHANMEKNVKKRNEVIRGRINKEEQPEHWVYDKVSFGTIGEVIRSAGFRRYAAVGWKEQIKAHGEGHEYPGAKYAFDDPHFNKS